MQQRPQQQEEPDSGGVVPPLNASEQPLSARKAAAVIRADHGVIVSDQSLLNWAASGEMGPGAAHENDPPRWVMVGQDRMYYPAACAAWIARNKPRYGRHGGARPGVGRKKKAPTPHMSTEKGPDEPAVIERLTADAEERKRAEEKRREEEERRNRLHRLTDPNLLAEAMRKEDDGGITLAEAQRLKVIAEGRIRTIEAQQLERSVLPKAEVERGVSELCQVLRDGLEAAPEEVGAEVAAELSLDAAQTQVVVDVVRSAVERALQAMHAAAAAKAEEYTAAISEAA
jgi:hypothetical protein